MLIPTPDTSGSARPARHQLGSPSLELDVRHRSEPCLWDDFPGIEEWVFSAYLNYSIRSDELPRVLVARAEMHRVNCVQCDFGDLDQMSGELGLIADAIDERAELMDDHGIVEGAAGVLMIADDVVVDPFWRGHRIGPALVRYAADLFAADGVFLVPAALATRINDNGECHTVYDLPHKGPAILNKVKTAWRRAGFRKLHDNVMWKPMPTGSDQRADGVAARSCLRAIVELADTYRARAWWQRRTHCQADDRTTRRRGVDRRRH